MLPLYPQLKFALVQLLPPLMEIFRKQLSADADIF